MSTLETIRSNFPSLHWYDYGDRWEARWIDSFIRISFNEKEEEWSGRFYIGNHLVMGYSRKDLSSLCGYIRDYVFRSFSPLAMEPTPISCCRLVFPNLVWVKQENSWIGKGPLGNIELASYNGVWNASIEMGSKGKLMSMGSLSECLLGLAVRISKELSSYLPSSTLSLGDGAAKISVVEGGEEGHE